MITTLSLVNIHPLTWLQVFFSCSETLHVFSVWLLGGIAGSRDWPRVFPVQRPAPQAARLLWSFQEVPQPLGNQQTDLVALPCTRPSIHKEKNIFPLTQDTLWPCARTQEQPQ